VYVAKRDIPQGTSGADLIRQGWITTQDVVQRTVVPGAISSPDQVRTLITRQEIYAGEQISMRRFAGHAEQGVRVQLHGTLRAVSLPGSADALLAGTLRDGDHVDMVANLKCGSDCFATRVVARNVLVLKAPTGAAGSKVTNTGGSASSVLLAVKDSREEQKVWYAVQNSAGWALALRPVTNAADSAEDLEGQTSMLRDGLNASNFQHYLTGSGK
jgi:Flp pilus assembly protein CpaB